MSAAEGDSGNASRTSTDWLVLGLCTLLLPDNHVVRVAFASRAILAVLMIHRQIVNADAFGFVQERLSGSGDRMHRAHMPASLECTAPTRRILLLAPLGFSTFLAPFILRALVLTCLRMSPFSYTVHKAKSVRLMSTSNLRATLFPLLYRIAVLTVAYTSNRCSSSSRGLTPWS